MLQTEVENSYFLAIQLKRTNLGFFLPIFPFASESDCLALWQ